MEFKGGVREKEKEIGKKRGWKFFITLLKQIASCKACLISSLYQKEKERKKIKPKLEKNKITLIYLLSLFSIRLAYEVK